MATTDRIMGTVFEGGGASFMARVAGNDAVNLSAAHLSGITYKVYDLDGATPDSATASGTITLSTSVFSALQTDARWSADATGYNFRHDIPASIFATGDHRYLIEYLFNPKTGEDFWVLGEFHVKAVKAT